MTSTNLLRGVGTTSSLLDHFPEIHRRHGAPPGNTVPFYATSFPMPIAGTIRIGIWRPFPHPGLWLTAEPHRVKCWRFDGSAQEWRE